MTKSVNIRYATSLGEIYAHIKNICAQTKQGERPLLWFRGHEYEHYHLEPNLFRGCSYLYNSPRTYSQNHLREEYRFQNFMSRNFDKIDDRMPQTMIEWQEVMQHYGTKTRLMDWSESLTVALGFALEAFIKPVKDLEVKEHCRTATPTLWILRPAELNKAVYDSFADGRLEIIAKALNTHTETGRWDLARKLQTELYQQKESGMYYNLHNKDESNMNVMIGLSSLELLRKAYVGREQEALRNLEWNPFFYLLLRYYSDGVPVEQDAIPPLSIIHPYHSPRIKSQKGVFTIFPYYIPNARQKTLKEIMEKEPPIAMEYMEQCAPYLHKVQILDPQRVADELMLTGARRGNLYPEMENISQDMENIVH